LVWLTAIFAVGLVIRGYFLAQPMRYDESFTFLNYVNHSGHLFLYKLPNNHVLHTVFAKLSTLLWGSHPVSIRFPAFLFGIASVPLTFCFCRKLIHERSGFLASIGMAVLPYMVLYSTNARGYSLLVFLTLALAFVGMHVAERPSPQGWALTSLIAALGMMTMPSMLFPIAGLYLWFACLLFLNGRTVTGILREFIIPCTIMTFAFTLILYIPSMVASGGVKPIIANPHMQSLQWNDFFHRIYPHVRTVFSRFSRDVPCSVLFIGVILLVAGLFRGLRKRDWPPLLLLPSVLLGSGVFFLIKHSIPKAGTWIYLIPFTLVLADSGVTYLVEMLPRSLRFLLPLLLFSIGLSYALSLMSRDAIAKYQDTGHFPEAPSVAEYLKPVMSRGDIVHSRTPADFPMRFYLRYFGMGKKQATNPKVGKEFFVVKKSRYTIDDLTDKPVIKLLDFDDAALYQLLPTAEVPTEEGMVHTNEGLRLMVTRIPSGAAGEP
jgi:4-amino-4-deoxy-L-arabinose transferase-like glycosyltransferase